MELREPIKILYAAEPRKSKFCERCRYKNMCDSDRIPEQMKPT